MKLTHVRNSVLKSFNDPWSFYPLLAIIRVLNWGEKPWLSLVSIFYKPKDPGLLETDLYLFKSDFFQPHLPVMPISYFEWLLFSGIFKCIILKTTWHYFDSWSFMFLEQVWFPSKLFILLSLFTCYIVLVLYCRVTNNYNFNGLKQHSFILQFLSQESGHFNWVFCYKAAVKVVAGTRVSSVD